MLCLRGRHVHLFLRKFWLAQRQCADEIAANNVAEHMLRIYWLPRA